MHGPARRWQKGTAPTLLPEKLQGVSAAIVRQHFMRSEIRFMSKHEEDLYAAVFVKLMELPPFNAVPNNGPMVEKAIKNITARLQQSDLTINFSATSWFATKNTSTVYQQMYERGVSKAKDGSGKLFMTGNAMNEAEKRDKVDTRVMFRQGVGTGSTSGIGRFMQTGGLTEASDGSYEVANKHFNARTRQTFAALNWKRNPSGAATEYGASHFILKESLKQNAIYYMGDTFSSGATAESRATFGTIFALILWSPPKVVEGIIRATWYNIDNDRTFGNLTDGQGTSLLEAHIYEQITFRGSVGQMILDRLDCNKLFSNWMLRANQNDGAPEPPKADAVIANAQEFCTRNGIKLTVQG